MTNDSNIEDDPFASYGAAIAVREHIEEIVAGCVKAGLPMWIIGPVLTGVGARCTIAAGGHTRTAIMLRDQADRIEAELKERGH